MTTLAIHNSIRQHILQKKVNIFFCVFIKTYDVQQYMIKNSLGLGFMIKFKPKLLNNILLIPSLAFTSFVTSHNVLLTSLNLNKNPMSSKFYYKLELMIKILLL